MTVDLPAAALYIATELGWPVLPIRPGAKVPLLRHGLRGASSDARTVRAWWSRWPSAGIGVRCDRHLVIDLDDRPDHENGWDQWVRIAEPRGWHTTDTLICSTPSGGVHIWWALPDDIELPGAGKAGELASSVDTRTGASYAIVPPTPGYLVEHDVPPAPAPAWLIRKFTELRRQSPGRPSASVTPLGSGGTPYGLRAMKDELATLATTGEGRRNDQLNESAYALGQLAAGAQLDPAHAASQLHLVAVRIGLDDREATATIRSGMTAGAREPRRPPAA